MALIAVLLVGLVAGVSAAAAPWVAAQDDGSVEVTVAAGFDGVVGDATTFPVTVTMTSARARTVQVRLEVEGGRREYRAELVSGAPVELDVAATMPPFDVTSFRVNAQVTDLDDRRLGSGEVEVVPRGDHTLVGVGASIAPGEQERTRPTLGGIQQVALVPLDALTLDRPGALDSLSGIVLGPADLDELDEAHHAELRRWVWAGGNLALDVPRSEQLPVVELSAGAGSRTAVGAGWVRFTDGRAAAGSWESVLEPSLARVSPPEAGMFWGDEGRFEWLDLIDVSFLPVTVVLLAVFGTAVLAGPLLWITLRTRQRRRWMWVASPALSLGIAAALLVVGQGVFTRADARAAATVVTNPWGATGEAVFGLKESHRVTLDPEVEVVGSSPEATVADAGGARAIEVDLPRNGFGYLGLGPVDLDGGPLIEVRAVAAGEDTAEITVTNHTDDRLTGVSVRSVSRSRPFEDVAPGASVTLPFLVDAEISPFGELYPFDGFVMPDADVSSMAPQLLPVARGVVQVSGTLWGPVRAAGLEGSGRTIVRATAPIGDGEDVAALRIESVGASRPRPEGFDGGPGFFPDGATTTTVAGPAPDGTSALTTSYARLVSGAGRPAGSCSVHTAVREVARWDGTAWVDVPTVGDAYDSPRMLPPNQVQGRDLPAIAPGEAVYLRLRSPMPLHMPLVFDCRGTP